MSSTENTSSSPDLLSLKMAVRTKDFVASKAFYLQVLNLKIEEEYNDGNGSSGCIMRFGPESSNAFIEISEIKKEHSYYEKSFGESLSNKKIDIQLKTNDVHYWAERLKEKEWPARGPIDRPWGWKYLYLKDPDGLQIIIYEEG